MAAVVQSSHECSGRCLSDFFFDKFRESEVNEDDLFRRGAYHNVLRLDITVNEMQPMHERHIGKESR